MRNLSRSPAARASSPLGYRDEPLLAWAAGRLLDGLRLAGAVWTGQDLVVAAVSPAPFIDGTTRNRLALAAVTPATGRWRLITPALPPGHPPLDLDLLYAGGRLLLWSPWDYAVAANSGLGGWASTSWP